MIIRSPFNIHVRRFDLCLDGPGTGPVLWTPADAGLTAYWLADDISGANGDPVGTWPDAVGSNDATASGSSRPTLSLNAINGKAAVVFDGVDDGMEWVTQLTVGPNAVIFSVVSRTVNTEIVFAVGGDAPTTRPLYSFWNGTTDILSMNSFGSAVSTSGDTTTGAHIFTTHFSNAAPVNRKDGSIITSIDSIPPDGNDTLKYLGYQRWGFNLPNSRYTQGSLMFVAVLDSTYTPDIIERLEGWAAHYYGLTANLPIGHPYKSFPPYK